jgi:nitroreductase/NAD-dependent dihydropyrimidine dehydrogenase PreA subunit
MNTVSFDRNLCDGCGMCAGVCPTGIISFDAKKPEISAENASLCVYCGHCEAVCHKNAVKVEGGILKPSIYAAPGDMPSREQLGRYFAARRSIRNYRPEPVDKQTIEDIFDIVRYAPSGVNRQPVKWLFVHDTEQLKEMSTLVIEWIKDVIVKNPQVAEAYGFPRLAAAYKKGGDPITRNAPHVAVAHAPKDNRIAAIDAVIALSHLELLCPAFGLGACWAGYFNMAATMYPPLISALGIPDGSVALGTMMLGYPKFGYKTIPKRNKTVIRWI